MYHQDLTNAPPGTGSGSGEGGAQDKAKQAGEAARQGAQDVAGTAKEQGREVAREARHQARSVASDVRRSVQGQARTQNQRLAGGLRNMSDQFRDMGPGDESPAGQVVQRLGEGGRRAADYLENKGPEGLLDDVQQFARRKPGTFLLIAAAAGFVVGRLGRAAVAASKDDGSPSSASRLSAAPDAYPEGEGVYRSATASEGYPVGGYATETYSAGQPTNAGPASAYPDIPATGQPAAPPVPPAAQPYPADPYPAEPYPTERPR